jgi:hypothetical protein
MWISLMLELFKGIYVPSVVVYMMLLAVLVGLLVAALRVAFWGMSFVVCCSAIMKMVS